MLHHPVLAVLGALFLWWAATGILLWCVHRADRDSGPGRHEATVLLALPLLIGGVTVARVTEGTLAPWAVWMAFVAALAIWAWIELAFLSGVVTGPVTTACPPGLVGAARFRRAFGTIAWHEGALVAALAWLAVTTAQGPNRFAFYTFLILFCARVFAKLNLFLGAPRINTHFLPRPVAHLGSYFRQGPVSGFFPLSVTLLALTLGCLIDQWWRAVADGPALGFSLLSALSALALLEHWFMVWKLNDDKLWRWMIPSPRNEKTKLRGKPHGF